MRTDTEQWEFLFGGFKEIAKRKNFLGTGNALIFTFVKPKAFKEGELLPGTKFNSMVISYEDLSILSEKEISFEYPYYPYAYTETADGGFAIVLMPMNQGTLAGFLVKSEVKIQPNLKEFVLLTVDAEGNETGRYPFTVGHAHANLQVSQNYNDDYLIYGFSNDFTVDSYDKKPNMTMGYLDDPNEEYGKSGIRLGSPTSFEFVKISKEGSVLFSKAMSLKNALENVAKSSDKDVKLPDAGKWEKYFRDAPLLSQLYEANGQYYIQFTTGDKNYQLLQFDDNGAFVASYFTPKTGDLLAETAVITGPNSTILWLRSEHKEGKPAWLTFTQLNPKKKEIIATEIPGNKKVYGSLNANFAAAEGLNELVFYLQDGKDIFLGKLPIK